MTTGLVYDPIFLQHVNPHGHPERVERLEAVYRQLSESGDLERLQSIPSADIARSLLETIHEPAYIDSLDALSGKETYLDADTYVSPESVRAAYRAAGSAVALAEAVYAGKVGNGIALLRPPGHHAESGRAMGFCLFNNIALAASALLEKGANRVAIFDWDVHHGNGTQHSFESDPRVLYLSTHQFPFYPGTGAATEVGRGEGRGFNVNVPLPGGCGDAEYLAAVDEVIVPVIEQFQPDALLISAGFDSYEADPLAGMRVTEYGYGQLARRMRSVAERVCGGRIVYMLEGGYDLEGLAGGVAACVDDLLRPKMPEPLPVQPASRWPAVFEAVKRAQDGLWRL